MSKIGRKWLKIALVMFLFTVVVESGYSQKWKFGVEDSREDFDAGLQSLKDGKYSAALKKFNKIHRNDTNYIYGVVQKLRALRNLKNFDEGVALAKSSIVLGNRLTAKYYLALARMYSEMDSSKLAIQAFDDAIEKYPRYYRLGYYKAIHYYYNEEYEKAVQQLQVVLKQNPEYHAAHFMLGKWSAEQGYNAQAIMSLTTYMMLNPNFVYDSEEDGHGTVECFKLLDAVSNNSVDVEEPEDEKEKAKFDRREMDFLNIGYENMDVNIQNGVVLTKKYKTGAKVKRNMVNQIHYVMNHRKDFVKDGFWEDFYGPYFDKVLVEKKSFGKLMILVNLISSRDFYFKHNVTIYSYKNKAVEDWGDLHNDIAINLGDGEKEWRLHFSGERLASAGELKDDNRVGEWYFFQYDGSVSSHGSYTDLSKKDGDWVWYHINGNIMETATYDKGKRDGEVIAFRELGTKSYHNRYKNGEVVGPTEFYDVPGHRYGYEETNKKVKDGKLKYFYANGEISYEATEKNAVTEGVVKRYFPSGEIRRETNYKSGKLSGERKYYDVYGTVIRVSNYKDGKKHGSYKEFFASGELELDATYKEGKLQSSTTYYKNGQKSYIQRYDEEGELDGIIESYDSDGLKHFDMKYEHGKPQKYTYYKKDGNVIKTGKLIKKDLNLVGYFPTGEKRVTGKYYNGERHGTWKYYNILGVLETEIKYDNGEKDGLSKDYFNNGRIYKKQNYSYGSLEGKYERYYRNGQLYCEGYYQSGDQVGEWRYYTEEGKLDIRNYYSEDELDGIQEYYTNSGKLFKTKIYKEDYLIKITNLDTAGAVYNVIDLIKDSVDVIKYWNGKKLKEVHYKNGILDGKVLWYYPNGQIEVEGQYLNGRRDGNWTNYFEDGTIKQKRYYKLGENIGVWEWFFEDGKLSYKSPYVKGEESGLYQSYYSNGKIAAEIEMVDDRNHGLAKYYNKEGILAYSKLYHEGVVVAYISAKQDTTMVTKEEQKYTMHFENGNVSAEFTTMNGKLDGTFKMYYSNGKVQKHYSYDMGVYDGEVKVYNKTGKLYSSSNYVNGELNGVKKMYHSNGKLKMVSHYVVGELNGIRTYHSLSGGVTRTVYYYGDNIVGEK